MKILSHFAFCLSFCLVSSLSLASEENPVQIIPLGKEEIFAILDNSGKMDKKLLPQLNDYPAMEMHFQSGPLPSVSRGYFLKKGDRNIFIDTGWGSEQAVKGNLVDNLAKAGIPAESITDILLTHMDVDHIGGMVKNGKAVFPNAVIRVAAPEYNAWSKGDIKARNQHALDLAHQAIKTYGDKIKQFEYDSQPVPGILAIDASGHTPGHTAYAISSGDQKFMVIGDAIHVAPIQLLQPELSTVYDMDPQKAAVTRKNLLEKAAREKLKVGGMHMPAIGYVEMLPGGGFKIAETPAAK